MQYFQSTLLEGKKASHTTPWEGNSTSWQMQPSAIRKWTLWQFTPNNQTVNNPSRIVSQFLPNSATSTWMIKWQQFILGTNQDYPSLLRISACLLHTILYLIKQGACKSSAFHTALVLWPIPTQSPKYLFFVLIVSWLMSFWNGKRCAFILIYIEITP